MYAHVRPFLRAFFEKAHLELGPISLDKRHIVEDVHDLDVEQHQLFVDESRFSKDRFDQLEIVVILAEFRSELLVVSAIQVAKVHLEKRDPREIALSNPGSSRDVHRRTLIRSVYARKEQRGRCHRDDVHGVAEHDGEVDRVRQNERHLVPQVDGRFDELNRKM